MKKENLITLATIIFTVTISIFATRPSAIESAASVIPEATPSPRTNRSKTARSPRPTQPPTTQTTVAPRPNGIDISTPKLKTKKTTTRSKRRTPTGVGNTQTPQPATSTSNIKFDGVDGEIMTPSPSTTGQPATPPKKPATFREGGVNDTTNVNRTTPAAPGLVTNDTIDKKIAAPSNTPTASPCSSVTTNSKSPKSGRSSTKAMNKNCQEFEAVRPNSPQTPNAPQYNPKELSIDKVVRKRPAKNRRP